MIKGNGVSTGVGFGNVVVLKNNERKIEKKIIKNPEEEIEKLNNCRKSKWYGKGNNVSIFDDIARSNINTRSGKCNKNFKLQCRICCRSRV